MRDINDIKKLLREALKNGELCCLRDYCDIETQVGELLLWSAQYKTTRPIFKKLLKNGADVHAKGDEGTTALTLASMCNSTECVKALLEAGAELNAKTDYGDTALMWAKRLKKKECIDLLQCGSGW